MANNRHSFVGFYPSDWVAGTSRMTRLHRSIFFDVCCYIWDKNTECPAAQLPLMLGDLANWEALVADLVVAGKLTMDADGALTNARARHEAERAFQLWKVKSEGGRLGAQRRNSPGDDGSGDGSAGDADTKPDTADHGDKKAATAARSGTRLAPDFTVSNDWLKWAMTERKWSRTDAKAEAATFAEYYINKRGREGFRDNWLSTWRQWCLRAHRGPSEVNGSAYIKLADSKPAM